MPNPDEYYFLKSANQTYINMSSKILYSTVKICEIQNCFILNYFDMINLTLKTNLDLVRLLLSLNTGPLEASALVAVHPDFYSFNPIKSGISI